MRNINGIKGITIISLIVIIIILFILTGIVVRTLVGENAIILKTLQGKNVNSKAYIKEQLQMVVQELKIKEQGENKKITKTDYRDEIKKVLNEESVYIKDNDIIWIIKNNNIIVLKSDFTIEETIVNFKVKTNVDELKQDTSLKIGDEVYTLGYYEKADNGESRYLIEASNQEVDNGNVIELDNGLKAILQIESNSITAEQYGAIGDGVTDNYSYINTAVSKEDVYVSFNSNKEYKVTKALQIKKRGITIKGNDATIFTDNDYSSNVEWLFNIVNNDISIYNLTVEAREQIDVDYKTQLGIQKVKNIIVSECNFIVPKTVSSNKSYNNIDLYSGWHNIEISNCNLQVLSDTEAGGCIWIRDFGNLGASELVFKNNSCEKVTHDEILAIFMGTIENIQIVNNKFITQVKEASPSVMNFTIGSSDSKLVDNILLEENKIQVISSGGLIWAVNATNTTIRNNDIVYTRSESYETQNKLFRGYIDNVSNNNIKIYGEVENYNNKMYIFSGINEIKNNNVEIYTDVEDCFANCYNVESNNIILNGQCSNIFNGIKQQINSNLVEVNAYIEHVFQWYGQSLEKNVTIKNNTINYNYNEITNEKSSMVIIVNNSNLNGHRLEFIQNTIGINQISSKSCLLFFTAKDTIPQTILLKENQIEGYERMYIPNKNHNIIIEK